MADIILDQENHAHIRVWTTEAIERELSDEFSFEVPGFDFMKKKNRHWDGRIKLFNRITKLIYAGLAPRIMEWATLQGYTIESKIPRTTAEWTDTQTLSLFASHPTPPDLSIRDYQQDAITYGMHHQRCVLISPTASGKSLILYYLARARVAHGPVLVVVPTISLVSQMVEDWRGYGWDNVDQFVHRITGGVTKQTDKPIVVTTWQSVFKLPEDWFTRYRSILGDECHLYKATSLVGIMEKLPQCKFRVGVTGTLSEMKSNRLMVEGVFGVPYQVARTAELQQRGHLTPISVQGHFLQYDATDRWHFREHVSAYAEELDFVVQHPGRMAWMVDFVNRLPGNVLVLYQFVEKHGIPLYREIKAKVGNSRPIYFVSGDVSADSRERVRALLEHEEHVILTFPAGDIRCTPTEAVALSNGLSVAAQDITPDTDVSDSWIAERFKESPTLKGTLPNV